MTAGESRGITELLVAWCNSDRAALDSLGWTEGFLRLANTAPTHPPGWSNRRSHRSATSSGSRRIGRASQKTPCRRRSSPFSFSVGVLGSNGADRRVEVFLDPFQASTALQVPHDLAGQSRVLLGRSDSRIGLGITD